MSMNVIGRQPGSSPSGCLTVLPDYHIHRGSLSIRPWNKCGHFFRERSYFFRRAAMRDHSRFRRNRAIPRPWYISAHFLPSVIFSENNFKISRKKNAEKVGLSTQIICLLFFVTYLFSQSDFSDL